MDTCDKKNLCVSNFSTFEHIDHLAEKYTFIYTIIPLFKNILSLHDNGKSLIFQYRLKYGLLPFHKETSAKITLM
jgi:hypothetical protein